MRRAIIVCEFFSIINSINGSRKVKKAFTLVEMLVVIGILGILIAVLLGALSGTTESARAAKCLANMRNLASACQSYGMANQYLPLAASLQSYSLDESQGIGNSKRVYFERRGWISWYSDGAYASKPTSSVASGSWFTSAYADNDGQRDDEGLYCLTNGVLWKYVAQNFDVYICPSHKKVAQKFNKVPRWSYAMNASFGGDVAKKGKTFDEHYYGTLYSSLNRADRRLLFAELKFLADEGKMAELDETENGADSIFQYRGLSDLGGSADKLAFNHFIGNKRCAHVVFADGHVERLIQPKSDENGSNNTEELAEWLCKGLDVTFDGSKYDKLEN